MHPVAVVTDSTADLPAAVAEAEGLRVVPLTVSFGDEDFQSRITLSDEAFYARLHDGRGLPSTSQPSPTWFAEAYADADDDGHAGVVSVHLSARLSGTVDRARVEARDAALPVRVVDSRTVSGGLGLGVLAASRVAAAGGNVDDVAHAAERACARSNIVVVLDTTEYLRRGGRLGSAASALGTVLRVKPLLTIADGEVAPLDRVRTWSRAIDRLVEATAAHAGDEPCDVMVTHALSPERAAEVADRVRQRVDVQDLHTTVIGPVVGTHSGPGAVAVAVTSREAS